MPELKTHGITQQDYSAWRHHPVSKLILGYMKDYRGALHRDLLMNFEAGSLELSGENEVRGRCNTLAELVDLPFEAVVSFYQEEETENEAETAEGL